MSQLQSNTEELFLVINGPDEGKVGKLIDQSHRCGLLELADGRQTWFRWREIMLKPVDTFRMMIWKAIQAQRESNHADLQESH